MVTIACLIAPVVTTIYVIFFNCSNEIQRGGNTVLAYTGCAG